MSPRPPWSLRRRLVVGIVGLLAVLSIVIGMSSVLALRQNLLARLDDQVMDAARRAAGPAFGGQPDQADAPGNRIGTLVVRVRDGIAIRAEYVTPSGTADALDAAQIARLLALDLGERPVTVDLGDLGEFRVAARNAPGRDDTAIAGLPTDEVTATTTNLALIFALVTLAAIAVAALTGAQVVRVALRPLDRVTATARRVAELPLAHGQVALAERAPDTDPRTEVGQVGAAFNRMLEHVESALLSRHESEERVRRFVADASHELRTPLASIRGYSELTRRSGFELPDDIVYALARIESESVRMTSLVEELLLLARLDAGQELVHDVVDLVPLIADAIADAHAASPEHRWTIEVGDEPVLVAGDANRLQQVVGNLLTNARVHTPGGTAVTARLEREGDEAVVTVADDGPGIPGDLQPVLFERFARGDGSRSRSSGSTGLGLAIVAAIVDAHRGTVAARSRSGDTRFIVRLPLASPVR